MLRIPKDTIDTILISLLFIWLRFRLALFTIYRLITVVRPTRTNQIEVTFYMDRWGMYDMNEFHMSQEILGNCKGKKGHILRIVPICYTIPPAQ